MERYYRLTAALFLAFAAAPGARGADTPYDLLTTASRAVSGERARDYTVRMWRYDRWFNFFGFRGSANEARKIMEERGFDEAEIVDTPADGVTLYGAWTNPIGWDATQATLEVIEPSDVPEEYRRLCDYQANPISLNQFSCPTPPGGVETELVLADNVDSDALAQLNARGKIILTSAFPRSIKLYMARNGILGAVSDFMEPRNHDLINVNQWLNGWSDQPGGWLMTAADDRNQFGFSISQKKGNYLRGLLRSGKKVRMRAKIDSRYFTDGSLPYITGCVRGSDESAGDVIALAHIFEWGANDNAGGAAVILEAVGALNDLIRAGELARPKRSIRVWFGHEIYGSMAFTANNINRIRTQTLATLCCDGIDRYGRPVTALLNPDGCPSFTDAVFPELLRLYFTRIAPGPPWGTESYSQWDNFFVDPIIGVPSNTITQYEYEGENMHHNSLDTISEVDPRSLRDLSVLTAAYLYLVANAGDSDVQWMARLTRDQSEQVLFEKYNRQSAHIGNTSGAQLNQALDRGVRTMGYYTGRRKEALDSIARIVPEGDRAGVRKRLAPYRADLDELGALLAGRLRNEAEQKAKEENLTLSQPNAPRAAAALSSGKLIPRRTIFGTLTLEGVPPEAWVGVKKSPRWWNAKNWPTAAWWWCDGVRNLDSIRELMEYEADGPVRGFDLEAYFRFLEKYGFVEFVK